MTARGFTMIELMVALLMVAITTTVATALALGGLASTAEARRADTAAALAADLAGRVRALRSVDWTALPPAAPCDLPCSPERLAAQELAQWQAEVASALPDGTTLLEASAGGHLVIRLAWTETGGLSRTMSWGIAR